MLELLTWTNAFHALSGNPKFTGLKVAKKREKNEKLFLGFVAMSQSSLVINRKFPFSIK